MSDVVANIAVVLLFVLIGGFFAAAEIALISLRESQVQRLAETSRRGRRLAVLTSNPNRYLAAVQVGVTLAGFISAGFGAAQIAPQLAKPLVGAGMSSGLAETLAFIVVTLLIAYLSLVLGELVPKRIALQSAERVAMVVAVPIDLVASFFRPFIVALSWSTNAVVRLLGGDPETAREAMSEEELRDLVAGHGELTEDERALIDDVFAAGERELREVMVPRTEVDFLDAGMPVFVAAKLVMDQPHSRYPVMRDSADDVIGFVHIRDILNPGLTERSIRVGELARDVLFLPASKIVLATLNEMRRSRHHLAIVQDEYGGTAGIVTMEDLVEELVGEIEDEYDEARPAEVAGPRGETTVDGLLNLWDLQEATGLRVPDGPYETVAGFVVSRLGRLPALGDIVEEAGSTLEVVALDGRRVARVRVVAMSSTGEPEPDEDATE